MARRPAEILARVSEEQARRAAEAEALVHEIRARIGSLAGVLRREFGAKEVVLFGSFVGGDPQRDSDVDLAVTGLALRDHFRAMAKLSRALGRPVDLVRLEDLASEDRERVLREGEAV